MFLKKVAAAGAFIGLMGSSVYAANCGPAGQSIRILASDFPAIHAVAGTAEENCGAATAEFSRNHTTEARQIMNAALTPNPAEYTSVIVASSTLTQLMNDGLVRPLNDLVDKYGQNIPSNLLITIDGNVMAVAFMANAQHLFSRKDILEKAGVDGIPATYDEVLAAAEKIRAVGIMEYPLVMNMKIGWNVGESFNRFPWKLSAISVRVTRRVRCSQVISRPCRSTVLPFELFDGCRNTETEPSVSSNRSIRLLGISDQMR